MKITIQDGVDGGIIEEAHMDADDPTYNYGTRNNMYCSTYVTGHQNWAIKTDLSGYSNITVSLAKYVLNCWNETGSTFACKLWPINRVWNEGTKNDVAETGSICSQSARLNEEDWTTDNARDGGTDYDDTTPTAEFTSPSSSGIYELLLNTDIVQTRIGATNQGDVCNPVTLSNTGLFVTYTGESGNPPQFYMEYTIDAVTGFWYHNKFIHTRD